MSNDVKISKIGGSSDSSQKEVTDGTKATVYRFDIFKGVKDANGKVVKVKSVGGAYIREGLKTYTIHLRTFLSDTFYMLPNTKGSRLEDYDFVLLTRELAQHSGRKYFWHSVGEGKMQSGDNHGLVELSFDLLVEDIYMNLHPVNVTELPEAKLANVA